MGARDVSMYHWNRITTNWEWSKDGVRTLPYPHDIYVPGDLPTTTGHSLVLLASLGLKG